jgi:hypothetical protein
MINRSPQGSRRLRVIAVAAIAALLGSTAMATPGRAGTPFDVDCADAVDALAVELCLAQAESIAADEPGLGVDEIDSSPNLRQIANLPKPAPFDTESALNSDLAFQGRYAFVGNYNGFVIYDIANPRRPRLVSQVVCPGAQNDISVYGDLLFLSTDSSRSDDSCDSTAQSAAVKESWEGMKIFDIRDKKQPRYIKSRPTAVRTRTPWCQRRTTARSTCTSPRTARR